MRTALYALLISAACILAYWPAMHGKFLWDDLFLVGANPFFKSPRFVLEVFRHYLYPDSFSPYYRPVQNLSYILDYLLWNRWEFGYHLSNVLFHSAAAFFLCLVLRRCLGSLAGSSSAFVEGASVCVALLWALHPVQNAAVAYVAGRADSLAMLLALAGWLLFTAGLAGWRGGVAAALAALCFLAALCAKEIAFVWIALCILYLFAFARGVPPRARVAIVASLIAVLAAYLALRHLAGDRPAAQAAAAPFGGRILLMLRALGQYTALLFFPANLHMERTLPAGLAFALLGVLTLGLFAFACWSPLPGRAIRIFGVAWFLLGFLPISNLFPLNAQVAEHWIYMPSAGFLLMLCGFACAAPPRLWPWPAAAVAVAVLALGLRTARRAADWADPETFFKQTIAAGGGSDRASLTLAKVYSDRGDLSAAETVLRAALERSPGYAAARINLGIDLVREGRSREGAALLTLPPAAEAAVAATLPATWTAALNLAHLQVSAGHPGAALAILDTAAARYPDVWDLLDFRAQILWTTQGPAAALPAVRQYAAAHWWHYPSHLLLGNLLASAGDVDAGLAALREAATLDVHNPEPFEAMAKADAQANRLQDALDAQAEAIHRDAGAPHEYQVLAAILQEMNQPGLAAAALRKAEQ